MAVVMMDGFDHLTEAQFVGTGKWVRFSNAGTIQAGRFGGQALAAGNGSLTRALPSSYSTLIAGFGWRTNVLSVNDDYVAFMAGATQAVRLQLATSGPNVVFKLLNSGGTILATGITPLVVSTWYHVAIKVVISATVGTVELRLNGLSTAEMSATGLNTGAANIDAFRLMTSNSQQSWCDDLYVLDTSGSAPTNDWLGDCRIETPAPNGNGANTAWTGAYTDIDDATTHDTDTTYISSSTPGDRETATLSDLVTTVGAVYAVQTNIVARKDDAGARTISPVLRIGGVNYDGTTTPGLAAGYLDYVQLYERLDPSGAAWSIATVNALEAGVKLVA